MIVIAWALAAAGCFFLVTPLPTVVSSSSTAFLPAHAPTLSGLTAMDRSFGSGRTQSFVFVVFENSHGLTTADKVVYRSLAAHLGDSPQRVSEVESFAGTPQAQATFVSRDKKAAYMVVGLPSAVGSPASNGEIRWLRATAAHLRAARGTVVQVSGDPAMIADLTTAVNEASNKTTAVSVVLLVAILLFIYRRLTTVLVPLATIGVALLCTRGVLSLAGQAGLPLSTYTDAFILAITLGAGTDYCVFLISRFREERLTSSTTDEAVTRALRRIGPSLLASAATVIIGAICMGFTQLAIFSTTGPPMAVCVAITVSVSLTFTPALLSFLGPRIGPARPGSRAWAALAVLVARRPGPVLACAVAALLVLAAFVPTMHLSFDERSAQPPDTPSNVGLAALNKHFPSNETLPDYLLIRADHDLANTRDLAVLNTLSTSLAKVDGVSRVASITRPDGRRIAAASIAKQLGTVATGLQTASSKLKGGEPAIKGMADGATKLSDGVAQAADGASQAQAGAQRLAKGENQLTAGIQGAQSGAVEITNNTRRLQDGARQLASGLQTAHGQVQGAVNGLQQAVAALKTDLLCGVDPVCARTRSGLEQLYNAEANQLIPGLDQAATAAQAIADGTGQLSTALSQLAAGLSQASSGSRQIARNQALLASKLGDLATGTRQIAQGSKQLTPGINQLLDQTRQLQSGLTESSSYLTTVHSRAGTPDAAGFYLPASALHQRSFKLARKAYLSADGRVARIQITTQDDPLSPAGLRTYDNLSRAAHQSLNHSDLQNADLVMTGAGGLGADLQHYLARDALLVLLSVLGIVLLILILTLRSIVAPLYLLASVILSCAAALGLTTLVFQQLVGQGVNFTVPVITFVLLVAVGADYNILLMSRMRENSAALSRETVVSALSATGPVITAAGVIFASTFVALISSPVQALTQTGFAVAAGLILDTLIVRSLVVPSCAALIGDASWWPLSRRHPRHVSGDQGTTA